jgi:hypothetical protein
MSAKRILALIAATFIALTLVGTTASTALAMRVPPPCAVTHTCP